MTLHFRTESGAHYEVADDRKSIRRIEGEDGNTKRRDGHWLRLQHMWPTEPEIGVSATLIIESLAAHGPDDRGTEHPHPEVTTRITTPVAEFWESQHGDHIESGSHG